MYIQFRLNMCYSFSASAISAIIILISVILVFYREHSKYDEWIAIFLLYVGAMQAIEAMIWMDIENQKYNAEISKYLPLYLIGQIVINCLWAYKFNPDIGIYFLITSLLVFILFAVTMNRYYYNTTIGPNGHQVWNTYRKDTKENIYWYRYKWLIPLLYILWFGPFIVIMGKDVINFWPFLYLAATNIYSLTMFMNTGEMASNWCFFISFAAAVLVVLPADAF